MLSRTKFEISKLINDMLDELPVEVFISDKTTFADIQMGGGQFIVEVVNRLQKFGHSDNNINDRVFGFSEKKLYFSYVMGKYSHLPVTFNIYNETINMKFDILLGNDPYQEKVGPNKTEPLWNKFFFKRMSLLKDGGYLALIHPSGWRNITGKFKDVQTTIKSKKVKFLSIHNEKDGMNTFGAETRYDYYILQNMVNDGEETVVRFQDGEIKNIIIDKMEFIPNGGIDLLNRLIAKDGEETVEMIHSYSDYETRKRWMSKIQTDEFNYPVVYTVDYLSQPTFYYSSTNQKGHYGKPKVIWSNGRISSIGNYVDTNGEYALTQFAYAIVDTVENLENIKKALDSKKFKNLMELCAVGQLTVNHKVVDKFKKDFWREFIDG